MDAHTRQMGRRMEYVRNVLSEKIDLHTDSHTTSCTWKHDLVAKHRFHLAHSADHMLTHSYSSCVKVFSRSVYPMCTDLQGSSTHRHTCACTLTHTHPVLLNRSGCFTSCNLHIKDMSACIITGVECVCVRVQKC